MDWKKRLKPGTPPMKDVLAPAALVFEITERITSRALRSLGLDTRGQRSRRDTPS